MMLLLFTILHSVVFSEAEECKASEIVVKTPDSLPNDIAEVLEKQLKNELYDMGGVAAYYVGNVGSSDQYTSVCLTGKKIKNLPYCLKLTAGKGKSITLEEFRSSYEKCTGECKRPRNKANNKSIAQALGLRPDPPRLAEKAVAVPKGSA
ncbi:unnamed protein product [Haemonchus placei]|uniref:Secreted protein n=1 Tax=Haemonchus placei TaxID=6290 RepID=A0A0N4WHF9_HAEPC|nr:unnamed protein product [Haemonchus placei]